MGENEERPVDEPAGAKIRALLASARDGDEHATAALFQLLYEDLRERARVAMKGQAPGHTLQPTAILNEAFLRLTGGAQDWKTREHFLISASLAMRHVLIDHARGKRRLKRNTQWVGQPLDEIAAQFEESAYDLEKLDMALKKLAEKEATMARAVELRFFGGASVEEAARILGMKLRTFERSWAVARAWLHAELR